MRRSPLFLCQFSQLGSDSLDFSLFSSVEKESSPKNSDYPHSSAAVSILSVTHISILNFVIAERIGTGIPKGVFIYTGSENT